MKISFNASGHVQGAPVDPDTTYSGRGWVCNSTWAASLALVEHTVAANKKLTFSYHGTIVGLTVPSNKTFIGRSNTGHGMVEKLSENFQKTV